MKYSLALLLGFSLFLCVCKKDPTVLNGKVVDKDTGLPIENAEVIINERIAPEPTAWEKIRLRTNANGEFSFRSDNTFSVYAISAGNGYYQTRLIPSQ